MTQHRELANSIASPIFDRIERDRTLILQNIADEIHDALVLDENARKHDRKREASATEYMRLREAYLTAPKVDL